MRYGSIQIVSLDLRQPLLERQFMDTITSKKTTKDNPKTLRVSGAEAIIRTLREDHIVAGFRHHTATLEDAFIHHIGELAERFDR